MFNWTTTTLINELPEKFMEQPLDKNKEVISDKLRIGKQLFEKRWVESIRKAEGHSAELCEYRLNLGGVSFEEGATIARLYIYVGLEGSEESIYANDWYRKGMPLSVSFAITNAADMAKAIVDSIKTFNAFTKGKKILEVTEDNRGTLTIKGTHEHQRIKKIAILVEDKDSILGEEKVIMEYEPNHKTHASVTEVKHGVNGFGTYSQLIKDLRLPTLANTNWTSPSKNEMPIVGALYTQYIITYYAPSMSNPSFTAIGNRSMSETTHVFWVKSDLVSNWETKLNIIDPEGDGLNTNQETIATVNDVDVHRSTNKKQSLVERIDALEKE
jgi:hypothetical protein